MENVREALASYANSNAGAFFQIGGQKVHLPETLGSDDIAPQATRSVSSVEGGHATNGATDRVIGGYPGDRIAEWSSAQKEGATRRLTWKTPQTIDRIALYDRPNPNDNITRSRLTFSDGTSIEVGVLPNEGDTPYEVRFPAKTVDWIEWKSEKVSEATEHAGLSEIAVFRAP